MKPLFRVLFAAALATAATGCKDFLDINTNPNQAVSVTPDQMLSAALAVTAANYHGAPTNYNSYSSYVAGFWTKSGTVSGFAEERGYNYSNIYYQGLFNQTYDNLNDYNLIQQGGVNGFPNHAAIARIMKVYNFQLLVDQYGDVPYSQALQGASNTTPAYDKAEDIYTDLIVQLKGAIADINAAGTNARTVGTEDIVFRGNMTKWKQFANSLRLRILLRQAEVPARAAYVRTEMAALQASTDGFITHDVVVQPGYAANAGQQNPFYNRYGFAAGAINPTSEYSFVIPTNYIIRQYETNSDPRITQLYRLGRRDSAPAYVGGDLGEQVSPTFSGTGTGLTGSRFLQGGTFLRAPGAPTVLMLLSEHLFSKSEAEVRNFFTATDAIAKQDYLDGIKASFMFTYRTATDLVAINGAGSTIAGSTATTPGVPEYNTYIAANATNGLVNWEATTTTVPHGTDATTTPLTTPRPVTKQEKILYQKYIASNTVASTEAWADFRRTGLPRFKRSTAVAATAPLPSRLFYPQSEVSTNAGSIPNNATTNQFTKIFWDVLD